jgi:membrane-bound lytic murein transglycosylase D
VVYLPIRATVASRVGTGIPPARGHAVASSKHATAKAGAPRGANIAKVPASSKQQVVREKRGGTPAKKKR